MTRFETITRWAWLPLALLAGAIASLHAADLRGVYAALELRLALQLLLMTLAAAVVAWLASRAFLASGRTGTLLLGCGVVFVGLSGVAAGPPSVAMNTAVTVHNLCIWLGALAHLLGVVMAGRQAVRPARRAVALALGYASTLVLVAAVSALAHAGVTPQFFVQGLGGTPLRQAVLGSAVAVYAAAGGSMLVRGRGSTAAFGRWYGLGLLLLAAGLGGVMLQRLNYSALTWVSMGAQWLGSLYLLVAALVASAAAGVPWAQAAKAPEQRAVRYALAVVFVVAATLLRLVFLDALGLAAPYEIYYPAVVLAAVLGGVGPAAVATVLALVSADYFFVEPRFAFGGGGWPGALAAGFFSVNCALIASIVLLLDRARERRQSAEHERVLAEARARAAEDSRDARERLRDSEARYRMLFDGIDEGVCVCEIVLDAAGTAVDYRFIEVNPAFEAMTGLRDATGKTAREMIPALEPHWIRIYAGVALEGLRMRFQESSPAIGRHFDVFAQPAEPRGRFVVVFTDITERRRGEAQLRSAAARDAWRLALTTALRPLADAAEVQAQASRLLGEHLGADRVLYWEQRGDQYVVERDWARGLPALRGSFPVASFGADNVKANQAGRVHFCADTANDAALAAEARAAFAAIGCAAYVSVPLVKDGVHVGGLSVHSAVPRTFSEEEVQAIQDTAEQTRADLERARSERALRDALQAAHARADELQAIMEAAPVAVWIAHDPQCARITGNRLGHELMKAPLQANLSASAPPQERVTAYLVLRDGVEVAPDDMPMQRSARLAAPVLGHELEVVLADGTVRCLLVNAVPLTNADGSVRGALSVGIDLTDRKAAERELQQADRRKDEFLATLAHELRNPLAPVRNAVHLLQLREAAPATLRYASDVIERQVARMVRLIDDLLDVSRVSRGLVRLQCEPLLLADVLRDAAESSGPAIEQGRQVLELNLPAQPIALMGDAARLAQVFGNLLHNAAKYSDPGARIVLEAALCDGQAVVTVADDGIGIEPSMLECVFDLFTQVGPSHERAQGGLGIGLSLVRTLVGLHGGRVVAQSEGLGRGSVFTVWLPVIASPRDVAALPPAAAPAAPRAARPLKVLQVDDNRDASEINRLLLESAGHEVRVAYDGQGGLDCALAWQPHAVLLDIGLPGRNGYEVARAIRQAGAEPRPLLMALTGWGQPEDAQRVMEAGFDLHFVKPIEPARLLAVLEAHAGSLPAHDTAAVPAR